MNQEYKIEKNIPLPKPKLKYSDLPLFDLEIGDSFLMEFESKYKAQNGRTQVLAAAKRINKDRDIPYYFVTSIIDERFLRIWRSE